jgi:hypothetical protein
MYTGQHRQNIDSMLKVQCRPERSGKLSPFEIGGREREVDRDCIRRLWPKWIDHFHAGLFEVRTIARHDRQAMNERGRSD